MNWLQRPEVVMALVYVFCAIFIALFLTLVEKRYQLLHRLSNRTWGRLAMKRMEKRSRFQSASNLLHHYEHVKQVIEVEKDQQRNLEDRLRDSHLLERYLKQLQSRKPLQRMEAAQHLCSIPAEEVRLALESALQQESDRPTKLYLAYAISELKNPASLPVLIQSLIGEHRWYRGRVNVLIVEYREALHHQLPSLLRREEFEIQELVLDYANEFLSSDLYDYTLRVVNRYEVVQKNRINFERDNTQFLLQRALQVLGKLYPQILATPRYRNSPNPLIRDAAITALASSGDPASSIQQLLPFLFREETSTIAQSAMLSIIQKQPHLVDDLLNQMPQLPESQQRILADLLMYKIEYLILQDYYLRQPQVDGRIETILRYGQCGKFLTFLNGNHDLELENRLLLVLRRLLATRVEVQQDAKRLLTPRLLQKLDLEVPLPTKRGTTVASRATRLRLIAILVVAMIFMPVLFVLLQGQELQGLAMGSILQRFVLHFVDGFAYYVIILNFIAFSLIGLSILYVRRQSQLWKLKTMSLLFKPRMLPSISIVAPAYNEEKSILESTNSLLNLLYPDYELIVVNDGSTDHTLQKLIDAYHLQKVDFPWAPSLETKPILDVYQNPHLPRLMVIHKMNGGKADSLNAGINLARKEYFCGIDADSLLEQTSLLKLAALQLDTGVETPALGGNIFPVNGCQVDQGVLTEVRIPHNRLARFQTMEYIRAFMSGRLGWASMNALLIISGAFALFRKERVVAAGGYLTSSGIYKRDTVGEDMELVVRIARVMKEAKLPFKIDYAYNANCWTEVPEDLVSLRKQRYRWHRGLIEIIMFHHQLLFRPAYGRIGMLAFPYFLIFEMLGPLLEIQGLLFVAIALVMGWLQWEVIVLLFVLTVLVGVIISMTALIIAEKDEQYFRMRDLNRLIGYAVLENFGPRQYFSLWRVSGFLKMLRPAEAWGQATRRGFHPTNNK